MRSIHIRNAYAQILPGESRIGLAGNDLSNFCQFILLEAIGKRKAIAHVDKKTIDQQRLQFTSHSMLPGLAYRVTPQCNPEEISGMRAHHIHVTHAHAASAAVATAAIWTKLK